MFSPKLERQIDVLLDKLCHGSSNRDTIDLLEVVCQLQAGPISTKHRRDRRKHHLTCPDGVEFTALEKHLLKGALPHCIQMATIRPNVLISQYDSDPADTVHFSKLPRIVESTTTNPNLCAETFPTLSSFKPRQEPTCLTTISVDAPDTRYSPIMLSSVGRDSDNKSIPSLIITRQTLRNMFKTLPRWALWNNWSDEQKREIHRLTTPSQKKVVTCHTKCKLPQNKKNHMDRNLNKLSPDLFTEDIERTESDAECTFFPKVKPFIPRYLLSRPGLAKDDPLTLLRFYCKHFHAGKWIKDYEQLVNDLQECTFQPNIHKYLTPPTQQLKPPKDPFKGSDPFGTLKEEFEEAWTKEKNEDENDSITKESKDNQRIFEDEPGVPKYRGAFPPNHSKCLNTRRTKHIKLMPLSSGCRSHCNNSVTPQSKSIRPQKWQYTLREGYVPSTFSTQISLSSPQNKRVDKGKERHDCYDWGKYIRLNGRHLLPVCIADVPRLENILYNAAPPWNELEHPDPTIIERSIYPGHNTVALTVKTSAEDYRVNEKRNFFSVVRHGIESGELVAPLRVMGIKRDAVADLEKRLKAAKPISLVELDEKRNKCTAF